MPSFKLIPVAQNELECIAEIVRKSFGGRHLRKDMSVQRFLDNVFVGYEHNKIDAYVDNLDNPTRVLILSRYVLFSSTTRVVSLLQYAMTDDDDIPVFVDFLKRYAEVFGCVAIQASVWGYKTKAKRDPLFDALGMEHQETVYAIEL